MTDRFEVKKFTAPTLEKKISFTATVVVFYVSPYPATNAPGHRSGLRVYALTGGEVGARAQVHQCRHRCGRGTVARAGITVQRPRRHDNTVLLLLLSVFFLLFGGY